MSLALVAILAAYLFGAVPFGYLAARWHGIDILHQGSGNIGATNVGRVLGRKWGSAVFLLDFAKGALPVALAFGLAHSNVDLRETHAAHWLPVACGLASIVGHMFPVYLRFRGGKGVATGAGVVSVLLPGPMLVSLGAWIVVVAATRYVSLASLLAAVVLCGAKLHLDRFPFDADAWPATAFCFVAAALVWLRHRENIGRLLHGTESRVRWISPTISRSLHVLALGLWFGSSAFLNFVVAPAIFHKFENLGSRPAAEERAFLPVTSAFDKAMGTRLAGAAVAPLFDWFYPLEGLCGLIVALTALAWSWTDASSHLHRLRSYLAVLALATVVAGWPLALKVGQLRFARYSGDAEIAAAANAAFGLWHTASLFLGFVTLLLVTVLMLLAVKLPEESDHREAGSGERGAESGEAGHTDAAATATQRPDGNAQGVNAGKQAMA